MNEIDGEENSENNNPFSVASVDRVPTSNKISIQDFHISRKLGQGAFGKVYLATYKF
jgi:serine/threonine protein kinase